MPTPVRAPTMKKFVEPPPEAVLRTGPPSMDELMKIISPLDPTVLYTDLHRIGSGYGFLDF
jgi:hypothetical protein